MYICIKRSITRELKPIKERKSERIQKKGLRSQLYYPRYVYIVRIKARLCMCVCLLAPSIIKLHLSHRPETLKKREYVHCIYTYRDATGSIYTNFADEQRNWCARLHSFVKANRSIGYWALYNVCQSLSLSLAPICVYIDVSVWKTSHQAQHVGRSSQSFSSTIIRLYRLVHSREPWK